MTPPIVPWRFAAGGLAITVIIVTGVVVVRSVRPDPSSASTGSPDPSTASTGSPVPDFTLAVGGRTAEQVGRGFLAANVDPDGRVVRRDQDGDTVSEGQAYAMLVAVALGDRATFRAVWSWTSRHLVRPDQTLSWHWRDGSVADASSAADADLDAARALVIAGRAFEDAELTTAGIKLGQAVLDVETVVTPLGRILVAGDWAREDPYAYNPSYPSPVAFHLLHRASGDQRWIELAEGSRAATRAFLDRNRLPPDWAQVDSRGGVRATAGPGGNGSEGVQYGYDAARMPLRYAESCSSDDVALAARLIAPLSRAPRHAAVRNLDGEAIGADESVVAMAGLAAVYAASGDRHRSATALAAADQLQQRQPSYYGGAWNALGRLMLTDRTLGGCPPLT